jgi:hypothetical protein
VGEPLDIDFECESSESGLIGNLLRFNCESNKNWFKIYSLYEDFYFRLDGSIYHSVNRSIYRTKCHQIKKIRIYKNVDTCIKDILVSFVLDFQVVKGYLTNDGIIKSQTFNVSCSNSVKYVFYKNFSIAKLKKEIYLKEIGKIPVSNQSFNLTIKNVYEKFIEFKFEWRFFCDLLLLLIVFLFLIINGIKCKRNLVPLLRRLIT